MPRPFSIVFLDVHPWDYNAETPYRRPLGGTQSAACYLAAALAARGHRVALSTHTSEPGSHRGVECVGREPGRDARWLGRFDVVVVLGTGAAAQLRPAFPETTRLVLWTGFAPNLKVMAHFAQPAEQALWDGFAFASLWQMRRYRETCGLSAEKCRVLRYGVAPDFAALPDRERPPPAAPAFLHTSAPARGLGVLLDAWPSIREALPGARLTVSSSQQTYMIDESADVHRALYARARATDGIDYVGGLAQPALAERAANCDGLLYPSVFTETGCIAAMEAMCAGLRVVTTDAAVLPETCAGYAALMALGDPATLARRFAAVAVADWRRALAAPDAWVKQRKAQQYFFRAVHRWNRLAASWEEWLARMIAGARGPVPAGLAGAR